MEFGEIREKVLCELNESLKKLPKEEVGQFVNKIRKDRRIFCDAAGRSRLQIEGFAMRLVQMGFDAHAVGEVTTPAIRPDDLLLICSASGETPVLVAHAQKAEKFGADICLITANSHSSLSDHCKLRIVIEASSKQQQSEASVQPMGSLFEQSVGIFLDMIVLQLMDQYQITGEDMYENHSNLE